MDKVSWTKVSWTDGSDTFRNSCSRKPPVKVAAPSVHETLSLWFQSKPLQIGTRLCTVVLYQGTTLVGP